MMQKFFALVFIFSGLSYYAQVEYNQGDILLKANYGFTNILRTDIKLDLIDYDKIDQEIEKGKCLGPFVVEAEYMLLEDLSLGLSYSFGQIDFNSTYRTLEYNSSTEATVIMQQENLAVNVQTVYLEATAHLSQITFGGSDRGRGSVHNVNTNSYSHLGLNDRLDLYASFGIGYRKLTYTYASSNSKDVEPVYSTRIPIRMILVGGMNIFLTENIALNVNIGFGHAAMARAGLAYRFGLGK